NASPAVTVRDAEWVATLGAQPPYSADENPPRHVATPRPEPSLSQAPAPAAAPPHAAPARVARGTGVLAVEAAPGWTQVDAATATPQRGGHVFAFDAARDQFLVALGHDALQSGPVGSPPRVLGGMLAVGGRDFLWSPSRPQP